MDLILIPVFYCDDVIAGDSAKKRSRNWSGQTSQKAKLIESFIEVQLTALESDYAIDR